MAEASVSGANEDQEETGNGRIKSYGRFRARSVYHLRRNALRSERCPTTTSLKRRALGYDVAGAVSRAVAAASRPGRPRANLRRCERLGMLRCDTAPAPGTN